MGLGNKLQRQNKGLLELRRKKGKGNAYGEGRGEGRERHGCAPDREGSWVLLPKGCKDGNLGEALRRISIEYS